MNTNENMRNMQDLEIVMGECYTCGEYLEMVYTDYCEVCV